MIELETERLNFRQWRESDFGDFSNYFADEETAKYVGGKKTREEAWRLMASYIGHYHLKGFGYLAVEEKSSDKLVGSVGLWKSEPWPQLELGYWVLPEMQGKGYATEAAGRVKEYAFTTLKSETLVSYIAPDNTASAKLAERLGAVHKEDIELLNLGLHGVFRYVNK